MQYFCHIAQMIQAYKNKRDARAKAKWDAMSLHDRFVYAEKSYERDELPELIAENKALDTAYTDLLGLFDRFYINVRAIVAEDILKSCALCSEQSWKVHSTYAKLETYLRRRNLNLATINYRNPQLFDAPPYTKLLQKRRAVAKFRARPVKEIAKDIKQCVAEFKDSVSGDGGWYETSVSTLSFFEKYQKYPHQYEENLFRIQLAFELLAKEVARLAVDDSLNPILHDNDFLQNHLLNVLRIWIEYAALQNDHVPDAVSKRYKLKKSFLKPARRAVKQNKQAIDFVSQHTDLPKDNGYMSIQELRETIIELGGASKLETLDQYAPAGDLVGIINDLLAQGAKYQPCCLGKPAPR